MSSPNHMTSVQGPEPASARESEQSHHDQTSETEPWPWREASASQLAMGLVFGVVFGFLLQKGGVAKFDILIGVLLLENFVVVKVMLTAIVVGMIGVYVLQRAGIIEPQLSDTIYGANTIGGLIFGVGFGLLAYCPGTTAAAAGQGNLDAWVGIAGMVFGSYLFALTSKFSSGTVSKWGDRGKLTWPELLNVPKGVFVAIAAPVLVGVLVILEILATQ
ncbi:YeeE/YedE thiosulfate transporter family protein [Thalassoroseus pseudoceratinae]|uniref:YeeE/YedE thiosulfate transporter family protein n=1 Tax=Thalassoroseus pseudoceratinae TaxID=2713176 RepID=UPI001F0DD59F|nr:YeeE/YedE thiosulfate transporter family protein [Thalassoroseus pseudoceratinae]